ncbi:hypothetical protein N7450_010981 [Penicillium hetheringtonii]|uniref:Uncharacterized protein n=1 Tax=Penicillium hetheringtonii TaxID=911720 RepID=A0AAD6D933_9EURO|nr:hypothetical protein N7450_010981 [Penicillium hetheringtonii]
MFRLFGDIWLDEPPEDRATAFKELLPLIRDLEHSTTQINMGLETNLLSSWDMDLAFERYREEEHTWWRRHQVDRPREYFVRPSGSLDAQVACHLFNPTFAVNNASFEETDDPSNPCIAQLHDAGFSSQNCLMFDHSARRDDSRHCSLIYPPDLWDVHERFISDLRSHMKAVVELSEQMTSVKRFIVFVNHPQFYMFTKGDNVRAQAFRAKQGGRQDLLLELAAGLGKINISADFYKLNPLLLRPFRPTKTNREHMSALKGQAYTAIRLSAPTPSIFPRFGEGSKDKFNLPEVEPASKNPAKVTGDMFEDDKALEEARSQQISQITEEIHELAAMFMPDTMSETVFDFTDRVECRRFIESIEAFEGELYQWEELPENIVELVQAQKGLRIDRQPIASRKEAETAYRLLQSGNIPECLSVIGLAFSFLTAYISTTLYMPVEAVDDLMILDTSPNRTVTRVCSGCRGRVLDDSFPYFAKRNPGYYVLRSSDTGCGRSGCPGGHVLFHPSRGAQKCVRALMGDLKNVPKPRILGNAPWDKLFLRHGTEELGDLPKVVEFKCPFDGCRAINKNHTPRWTIQLNPTLVTRQFKCPECGRKGDWIPVSANFDYVRSESLTRTWGRFAKKGCDLRIYPRRADVYFSQGHIDIRIAQLKEAKMFDDQRS